MRGNNNNINIKKKRLGSPTSRIMLMGYTAFDYVANI